MNSLSVLPVLCSEETHRQDEWRPVESGQSRWCSPTEIQYHLLITIKAVKKQVNDYVQYTQEELILF